MCASALLGQSTSCEPTGADADRDGLSQECERVLAAQFAPTLMVSSEACNWDSALGSLTGGYLFGAEPRDNDVVRLAYLPAYFQDCGWRGAKCWLRWRGGCDAHAGDSEIILVDVTRVDDGWKALRVFLSAHCFGGSDGRCRWFEAEALEWVGHSPVVWVAEGKNANYVSREACDSGHWFYDTCDRNRTTMRFPVAEARNIGSDAVRFPGGTRSAGCVSSTELAQPPSSQGSVECIWGLDPFRGWQATSGSDSSTPYRRYLVEIADFRTAGIGTSHER